MAFRDPLKKSISENRIFLGCSATLFAGALLTAFAFGANFSELYFFPALIGSALAFISVMFALAVLTLYPRIWGQMKNTPFKPRWTNTKSEVDRIMRTYIEDDRLTKGIPVFVAVLFMLMAIPVFKSLIPHINPYNLDPLFSKWDCDLHFGICPQYSLAPIIEKLSLVPLLNYSYNFWLGTMFGAYWYATFIDKDTARRNTFLWASLASWILMGWIGATLSASVGPIYFGEFYPETINPYAAYLNHLHEINEKSPIISLMVSDILLIISRDAAVIDLNGISAMPSMHVAVSCLITLYLWQVHRGWGIAAILFALLILTGSVYLAWHYAIDGYIAAILVVFLWIACGKICRRSS